MITMDMVGKIRRLHSRGKKSEREIARVTGLSRNTVAKWLKGSVEAPPKYRRASMPGKLAPFVEAVKQALEADSHRPKKERRSAKALHKEIAEAGYAGGYTRLTDFIREWRSQRDGAGVGKAFVPLAFEMGEAFQFDWSEEALVIGGIYRRLQVAHMKLCASRAFWLVAYPSQGHEMLFDAHTRGFVGLGGVASRGIYDNMKTAVDRVKKGKARIVNTRFAVMCAHYLFDAEFCNVASGWGEAGFRKACFALPQPARCANRAVGRGARGSSRRTCRTAAGASGSRRASAGGTAWPNSTRGWPSAAASYGRRSDIRNTSSSVWPRCLSSNAST